MLLACKLTTVTIEDAERPIPHRIPGQTDLNVIASSFFRSPDQRRRDAGRSEIPCDEVIHHFGRRESWMVGGTFIKGKPAYTKGLHVETSTVGPQSVIPIAPDRAIDSPGPPLRQLLGREAKVAYGSPAVAINKNVGAGSQLVPATIAIRSL